MGYSLWSPLNVLTHSYVSLSPLYSNIKSLFPPAAQISALYPKDSTTAQPYNFQHSLYTWAFGFVPSSSTPSYLYMIGPSRLRARRTSCPCRLIENDYNDFDSDAARAEKAANEADEDLPGSAEKPIDCKYLHLLRSDGSCLVRL
jgi:hypothetical protein